MYEKTRFVSGVSSAPPTRTASGSSPSCVFERVVVFVTNRSRWPFSRRRRTASAAPAIGSPETCRTPSMSSKIAAMTGSECIRVTKSVAVPLSEIVLRTSRSSGPGGQHAQKSETRVEAVFDVEASTALSDAQKRRVIAKAGPVLRAVAQDERSQLRNRELAVQRVVAALRDALHVERPRRPTKPTEASRERRLEDKRRRSQVKRLRQAPGVRSPGRRVCPGPPK